MKPIITIAGPPGAGKSFSTQCGLQGSLTIISSPNNIHPFTQWLKGHGKDTGKLPPRKVKLITPSMTALSDANGTLKPAFKSDDNGNLLPVNVMNELETVIRTLTQRTMIAVRDNQEPPYRHIIIDECGEFWSWVFEEILPTCTTKEGNIDPRQAFGKLASWTTKVTNQLRALPALGVGVALITHEREPDGAKKGGPRMPSAQLSAQLAAFSDGVLRRVIVDGDPTTNANMKRLWKCQVSATYHCKLRGLDDADAAAIEELELDQILNMAGFDV